MKRRYASADLLGARMCLARRCAGFSQQQVGDAVGTTRAAVSLWENGSTSPTAANLARAAAALEVSIDWLIGGCGQGPIEQIVRVLQALNPEEQADVGRRVGVGVLFDRFITPNI